jgi:nucleotide-binding universal stress UspA family protein
MSDRPPTAIAPLRRIVAATDFSAASEAVVERAAEWAAAHGASLTLAHVVPSSLWDDVGASLAAALGQARPTQEEAAAAAGQRLRREADELAARHRLRCEARVACGRVPQELARLVAATGADLLAVGSHGAHPVRELLGTTAQKLLRLAPCAVLVVKRPPPFDYARVLAPTDLSAPAAGALRATAAWLPHAHLTIAHAFELPYDGLMRYASVDDATVATYRDAARERLLRELAAWADAAGIGAARRTLRVEHGYPATCIDRWIGEFDADLVALAARGKSELEAAWLGSVSLHAVQTAPCDVLLLRGAALS